MRRKLLLIFILLVLIAAGLTAWLLTRPTTPQYAPGTQPPNIVFILVDDLGWRDVGYAGAAFFETPYIDRLADEGMVFNQAYSGAANCSPSRASLMSGTYTPRHHIYTAGGLSVGDPQMMRLLVPARERTDQALEDRAAEQFDITNALSGSFTCIPEVLNQAGYETAYLGKWHLGKNKQGFDSYWPNNRQNSKHAPYYGNIDIAEELTDRAVDWIEENKDRPFFLYLCHWDVHVPHRARQAVVGRYTAKLEQIPESERQNFSPVYAGMIEAVDKSVGRIVEKIDALGLSENTLIVFVSDNGGYAPVSQLAPLRGSKGSLFEGGVRVPMVMRWQGVIQSGSENDTPITSVDFLPTFAEMAHVSLPANQPVDGVDIGPLMHGESIPERAIFWHFPLYLSRQVDENSLTVPVPGGGVYHWLAVPSTSMRRGDWKLIEYLEDHSISLYNLEDDPGETNDLAESMPEIAAKLLAELHEWQAQTNAPIPEALNPQYTGIPSDTSPDMEVDVVDD